MGNFRGEGTGAARETAGTDVSSGARKFSTPRRGTSMTRVWYENPPGTAPAQGLYSHAGTSTGSRLVFVAGQVSVNNHNEIVGKGSFEQQFAQVFGNMGDVLRGLGCDFNSVVKFTSIFVHSQDIAPFMRLR
ncbi:MAG: RidA family protein, partial [Bradyrhizobiaceae bacterium]|nr:RidA family protein [Bradyrhizobiaceae bacterium]